MEMDRNAPLASALAAYHLDPVTTEAAALVAALCADFRAVFSRTVLEDGRVRVRLEMENGDSVGGLGATTELALANLYARTEGLPHA